MLIFASSLGGATGIGLEVARAFAQVRFPGIRDGLSLADLS